MIKLHLSQPFSSSDSSEEGIPLSERSLTIGDTSFDWLQSGGGLADDADARSGELEKERSEKRVQGKTDAEVNDCALVQDEQDIV